MIGNIDTYPLSIKLMSSTNGCSITTEWV